MPSDRQGLDTPRMASVGWEYTALIPPALPPVTSDQRLIANRTNCRFAANHANVWQDIVALTRVGAANEVDVFGNSLTAYNPGILRTNGRIRIDDNAIDNVGINALDSAATRARDNATHRHVHSRRQRLATGRGLRTTRLRSDAVCQVTLTYRRWNTLMMALLSRSPRPSRSACSSNC